ncbi:MFS transporter [Mycobacterium sp. DSM 3803]|nr:MFS transporter [Mycobacterium sp. DSM 3803]
MTRCQTDEHRLVRARGAVFALFVSFGIILATWAVHLPALQRAAGLSTSSLGTVLFVVGVGALAGMQLCGPLTDRFGTATIATVAGAAMAATVTVPLAMAQPILVGVGAFVFGFATGSADVAMNAAAVHVERGYGRAIMASFHAVFSIGTVIGSLLGAAGYALGAPTPVAAAAVGGGCVVLVGWAWFALHAWADTPQEPVVADAVESGPAGRPRKILVLGLLAFLLLLSEGSAMDWASVHAQHHFGASPALGTMAFGAFVTAMTVSRFTVDRIAQRIGPVAVIRYGCVVAAVGIAVVIVAPNLAVGVVGWILFGLGLSGGVPQVFTAAGNLGGASGRALSRVVGVGYLAILAGPAVIGWLGEVTSLNAAFAIPFFAVLACVATASTVAPNKSSGR